MLPGKKIFAHKAVLSARCEVLAAMFSGNFSESQQTTEVRKTHSMPLCKHIDDFIIGM